MNELKTITNTTLMKRVNTIRNEFAKVEKSAWTVAKCYYDIVNGELFKDDFETLTAFAEYMGVNKSTISRMVNAYTKKLACGLDAYTTAQVIEMLPIKDNEKVTECIELMAITPNDTQKEVRTKVKEYLHPETKETSETSETEETSETSETEKMFYYFYGDIQIMPTEEDCKKLEKILNKYLTSEDK